MYIRFLLSAFVICFSSVPVLAQKGLQPVIVTEVRTAEFYDRVEALGTLRANETVILTSTVTEEVTAINFDDGQYVKAGEVLVEMTSAQEAAELDAQMAAFEDARRQLERAIPLVKSGASSKSLLDDRQREFDTASANLEQVKSRIKDRIITAPFDGVLGLRNISLGTVLQPSTEITTLDDISVMKLDFSVPSIYLNSVKKGIKIKAESNSFEGRVFEGTISSIDSQIDPVTRSIIVRAVLPNPEGVLKPGLLMSVDILKNPREAIVLPEEAVVPQGRKNSVYVIESVENKTIVNKRDVLLGARHPGEVEILSGLKIGERVVTHGTMSLSDGLEVTVQAEQAEGESLADILKKQDNENSQMKD